MIHPDPAKREAGRRSFEAIAASAHRMGTRLLTVCTGSRDANDQWRQHPDNASPVAWRDLCVEIQHAIEIADREDILIGIEPELANVISSAQRARELIDAFGSDRLRIVLDPANLVDIAAPDQRRRVIEEAVELLQDRITLAHAKDRFADGRFAAAGDGVIDFGHVFGVWRRVGFSGAVITHGLTEADARRVAAFLSPKLRNHVRRRC
jgi:sugar phosphate isomerase/epimerase